MIQFRTSKEICEDVYYGQTLQADERDEMKQGKFHLCAAASTYYAGRHKLVGSLGTLAGCGRHVASRRLSDQGVTRDSPLMAHF
jgi:hypothetical protein